ASFLTAPLPKSLDPRLRGDDEPGSHAFPGSKRKPESPRFPMLVTRTIAADTDLLALHRQSPACYPLLLESAAHGAAQGRWDMLLAANGESLALHVDGVVRDAAGAELEGDFLSALDAQWRELRLPREEPRWPFRGGWALFLAYELAAQVEPVLALPPAPGALPVALALRCPAAVLRDRATGECVAVAEAGRDGLLESVEADLQAAPKLPPLPPWQPPRRCDEDPPTAFTNGVARILDYL